MKALADSGYEDVNVDVLDQSVALLCAYDDEYAPLKVVANKNKEYQADKAIEYGFDYIGGWFDKQWFDGEYVSELANIPSKDELIGKFLYLLKYPMQ